MKSWELIKPITLRPILDFTKDARKLIEAERILKGQISNEPTLRGVLKLLDNIDRNLMWYVEEQNLIGDRADAEKIKRRQRARAREILAEERNEIDAETFKDEERKRAKQKEATP